MKEDKLLTVREVSALLDVSEKDVMDLAENGTIPAYKIGGVYLRFKNNQVQEYRKKQALHNPREKENNDYSPQDKVKDFFYFNDFYIAAAIVVVLLLVIIFQG